MKYNSIILAFFLLISATSPVVKLPQVGSASYYGNDFHKLKTANGERFHRDSMTAAHRTLPFGTMLKVTNLKNSKWVIVRVNDRGPHRHNRIIDVSYAAAKKLDMISDGVARVRIELWKGEKEEPEPPLITGEQYQVQAGAFKIEEHATNVLDKLKSLGFTDATVEPKDYKGDKYYFVMCGKYSNKESANKCVKKLQEANIESLVVDK